jgi:hypothetical protein
MAMLVVASMTTTAGPSSLDLLLEREGLDLLGLLMVVSLQIVEE